MTTETGEPAGIGVIRALSQTHGLDILDGIETVRLSAREICERKSIPSTTFYRRIDDLVANDLVEAELRIDADGDHYKVYTSKVDAITLLRADVGEGYEIRVDEKDVEDGEPVQTPLLG